MAKLLQFAWLLVAIAIGVYVLILILDVVISNIVVIITWIMAALLVCGACLALMFLFAFLRWLFGKKD